MSHESIKICVPPFGQGLEEVLLIHWAVEPGQEIRRGDAVVEVETAKATQEVVAERAGVIESLLAEPGAMLNVGDPLYLLQISETIDESEKP
ncbi:biotin/lipoyl-containing protein [Micromonospora lutea]|uniref:Lipoyl-binding domain-containing protein n=1 Tax=Micromonospora lutea TaxID=419825 RepID=A0ABQ4IPC2_9ACTN|nr:lipoyl domain-containing protein [Micromonospora lutea]GIJ19751.1 hypothetical protein Vlu01_03750 [Micromonospora lutea]